MVDPLSAIGSAASVIQLVANLSKGLRTLRDAVHAVKDAPTAVQHIEDKIHGLGDYFEKINNIIRRRPPGIPDEAELHRVIQDLTVTCHSSLKVLQEKLPRRGAGNIGQAFRLWINDRAIKLAVEHVDEYTRYLSLLLHALNLYQLDGVEGKLRWIAKFLLETARPRAINEDTALFEDDHRALTTIRKVREFANNAATTIVSFQAGGLTSQSTIRQLSVYAPNSTIALSHETGRTRTLREADFELRANRKIFTRLRSLGFFETAVIMQKRAFDINDELASDHNVPVQPEESYTMKEELADMLVECKTEGSTEEALSILQELLNTGDLEPAARTDTNGSEKNLPLVLPSPYPPQQRKLQIHYKLGQLYKDTGQLDKALANLRIVFDTYAAEAPKDTQKIEQVGEQLWELYNLRVNLGIAGPRHIFISQLQGFKAELEKVTGRPLEQRALCDAALDWCRDEGVPVPEKNQEYRFDIVDDDGTSPLHRAAQTCQKDDVIRQMLDNSDTLENQDSNGDTPLMVVIGSANLTALPLLLQAGGSLKARDRHKQTPLHRSQNSEVTKVLLQYRMRRASAVTAGSVERQDRRESSSSMTTTVSMAIPASSYQDLDIDAQDAYKQTALYIACSRGQEKIVNLLLHAGANPNIALVNHTPLAAAIESRSALYQRQPERRVNIVAALILQGADPDAARNLRVLRRPRGIFLEIQRALEGRAGFNLLSSSATTLEVGGSSSSASRASGDQSSLSSFSATGAQLESLELPDLGPPSLDEITGTGT